MSWLARIARVAAGRRRVVVAASVGVVALVTAIGAIAYLTATGAGSAGASVTGLASPEVTATSPTPGTAHVAWTAVAAPDTPSLDNEVEFTVERKPSSASTWTFVCGTGTTRKAYDQLSCDDSPTVEDDYDYRVTAHFRSWTSEGIDSLHVTVDTTPPVVQSIDRADSNPTSASAVSWAVTFSENVTAVGANDFALAGAGATGASITGVSGGDGVYVVSVDTGSDGLLRLDLADDDSIEDAAGNKLGGTGTGNGDFTGQAYLVDKTGPSVTVEQKAGQADPTSALPIRFTVHFGESVADFDASDVTVGGSATPVAGNVSVTGSGQDYEIVVDAPPAVGNGTITASIGPGAAHDALGNANTASTSADNSVMYDTVDPTSSASGNDADWHNTAVTVGLSATDPGAPTTGSGIATITYQVDGGAVQTITGASGDVVIPAPSDHSNDGQHTITFRATDNAANQETPSHAVTVKIDTRAPTSSASGHDATWHNTAVTVALSATDPGVPTTGSGVAAIAYQVDGGAVQTINGASGNVVIAAPADHSNDGQHTLTFHATDNATNQETPDNSVTIKIDTTKPTTSIATSPASPDGSNEWFRQSGVQFTLAAADPGAPSTGAGIASVKYQIDGGALQTYSGAVTINTQGDHTVAYFATDDAGNVEAANTTHIKLDNVNPATTLTTTPGSPNGTNNWFKLASVTFTLSGTDATSGVADRFYTIDGGGQQTYTGTVTINTQGDHTVTFWSTDGAGNTEATNTTHIKLDNVGPVNALSLTSKTGGGSFLSGSTLYYQGSPAGTFKLQNAVSDATSGAASSTFAAFGGTATGWTHTTPDVQTTPTGGPYVSNTFGWSNGTSSSPTDAVTAADSAGNTTAVTLAFTRDNTAPTGGTVTVPAFVNTTSVQVTFTAGTDAASGVNPASGQLSRASGTLNPTTGNCTGFGSFTNIGATGPTSPYSDTVPATNACYQYRYTVSDNVGNAATSTSGNVAVDTTAPTVTNVALANSGTLGQANDNDTVAVTFGEVMDATRFCGTWSNGSTQNTSGSNEVTVTITDNGTNDLLTVAWTTCGAGGSHFGTIALNANYVSATRTFGGSANADRSEVTWNPSTRVFTIQLGAPSGATQSGVGAAVPSYSPDTTLTDRAGNAIGAGPFTGTSSRF